MHQHAPCLRRALHLLWRIQNPRCAAAGPHPKGGHGVRPPGLHEAWADLPAPPIARAYWQMAPDATWVDTLRRMLADEAHHRDINHAYASLPPGDLRDNPFAEEHMHDFDRAVRRRAEHVLNEALRATRAGETPSAT